MLSKVSWSVFLPALTALLLLAPSLAIGGPPTQSTCAVTTSAAPCLSANGGRSYLSLQNFSATIPVFCTTDGQTPTASLSYAVPTNYGAVWWDVEPTVPKGAILCVTASSSATLVVTEQTQ